VSAARRGARRRTLGPALRATRGSPAAPLPA